MQFGAHEATETHEMLLEKINTITHFSRYAQAARNPQLREMISRHTQDAIRSYNELVSLTRGGGTGRFAPINPGQHIAGADRQQIQYGLHNPPQFAPDAMPTDAEIAVAVLLCHKNGCRNAMWASLECADPNLRRSLVNSSVTCNNLAYEVFLWMNQQGLYQVPTLNERTAANFLNAYQPAGANVAGMTNPGTMNPGMMNPGMLNPGVVTQGQMWQ